MRCASTVPDTPGTVGRSEAIVVPVCVGVMGSQLAGAINGELPKYLLIVPVERRGLQLISHSPGQPQNIPSVLRVEGRVHGDGNLDGITICPSSMFHAMQKNNVCKLEPNEWNGSEPGI